MSFTTWLKTQTDRNDPVGDLARDVGYDKTWPIWGRTRRVFREYLCSMGDSGPGDIRPALAAFDAAWREWCQVRKKVREHLWA